MDEAGEFTGVKIVFQRDYTPTAKPNFPTGPSALEIGQRQEPPPYFINTLDARRYYTMLAACDQLILALRGRIRAAVDYDRRTADIVLECRLLEFRHRRQLDILHELTARAKQVRFTVLPDQYLQMYTLLPYFNF